MTAKDHSPRGLGVRSVNDKPRFEGLEERILLSAWIAQSERTEDFSGEGRTITADVRAAEVAAWRETVGPILSTGLIHAREQIEDRLAQGMQGGLAELSTPIVRIDDAGAIQVYVHVEEVSEGAVAALEAAGLDVEAPCPTMRLLQGWVSYASLDDLAAVGGVRSITLPSYAVTRTGSVNTEGDAILNADDVRSRFDALGIDGSGITVGVISDGIEHAANVQATGDLPEEIAADEDHLGSGDEGTAMLEIIHDLAPGADLAFYAVGSSSEMEGALEFLIGEGADVIVDDIGFYGEPMFEDGAVAEATPSTSKAVPADSGILRPTANEGQERGNPAEALRVQPEKTVGRKPRRGRIASEANASGKAGGYADGGTASGG